MTELLVVVLIGVAFGWCLESAGLGDPPRLSGLFYLRDFTVLKVMMSALLTTTLGAFWLGRLGMIDLGAFYVPATFLLPQLVGGLIFGAGFLLSGLCPGTSCVALASGRREGAAVILGLIAGMALFGFAFPIVSSFYLSTAQGAATLPGLFGAPYGVVVAILSVAGVLALAVIERWEAGR